MENEKKYSKIALISLILSLLTVIVFVYTLMFSKSLFMNLPYFLQFCFMEIIPILSIGLAIDSLYLIKKYNLKGKSLAITALVLIGLSYILYFVWP